MLGDADAVRVRDLRDRDPVLGRRLEVDVVGPDPGGHRKLQIRRLRNPLSGQIGGPEGLRDHDLGLRELALEDGLRPVLVRGHDEPVTAVLEEAPQPELARDAADELPAVEVEPRGSRRGLAVVVALDPGDVVARVRRRVPIDRVVIEHAQDGRHR